MKQAQQTPGMITERLRVRGQVQGVGFRPTVYRLAQQLMLKGEVLNDGKGVLILLQAEPAKIDLFIDHLHKQCPPLARIDEVERQVLETGPDFGEFSIVASANNSIDTGIVADAATCPD
ncbi:MAG: acylphosphatase, partial [Gammaproteobacteria bacterium]|nr:acylphosphatase [Gammaproteobacteria bacterium]